MWKSSLIKMAICTGAFAFGYVAGQLNTPKIPIAPVMHLTQDPVIANCPAAGFGAPEIADPLPEIENVLEIPVAALQETNPQPPVQEINLSDFDNPDEQIKLVLTADAETFTQDNEKIIENTDPLEPMFQLPEDQQLAYVHKLVASQEDSAIVALNDLILNDGTPIQEAAINGLISLLEMRTGHFAMIAENLTQNAVFLNDKQLQKLQEITQAAAGIADGGGS